MKNHLFYTVLLTLLVVGSLLGLSKLPTITIGEHTLRAVDILADVKSSSSKGQDSLPIIELKELDELTGLLDSTDLFAQDTLENSSLNELAESSEATDTTTVNEQVTLQRIYPNKTWQSIDTNEEGLTYIVDYSENQSRGMGPFYEALNKVEEGKFARIAVFGDSFIEGDIFTVDLRSYLQSEYGGLGVGYVPITSATNGFRPSVIHTFNGWNSHSVTDKSGFKYNQQGIAGYYFVPVEENAFVELRGQKRYAQHLDTCEVASIFFKTSKPLSLTTRLNGGEERFFEIEESQDLQAVQVEGDIGRIRWTTPKDSLALFYGVAMDGRQGIVLDNFSLRGSSGYSLLSIPESNLKEFNALRSYDLIILQYGLNVVADGVYDYNYYRIQMNKVIAYLKKCFPNTGFLLLSVGDRDYKTADGTYETMPEIKYFLQIQRQIAKDCKIAFWNMFEAMGGENSMYDLVHDNPSKANYDYTHINFRGGRFMAKKLFESIVDGKIKYNKGEIYAGE